MTGVLIAIGTSIASGGRHTGVLALSTIETLLNLVNLKDETLLRDVRETKAALKSRIESDAAIARADAEEKQARARKTVAYAVLAENNVSRKLGQQTLVEPSIGDYNSGLTSRRAEAVKNLISALRALKAKGGSVEVDSAQIKALIRRPPAKRLVEGLKRGRARKRG